MKMSEKGTAETRKKKEEKIAVDNIFYAISKFRRKQFYVLARSSCILNRYINNMHS